MKYVCEHGNVIMCDQSEGASSCALRCTCGGRCDEHEPIPIEQAVPGFTRGTFAEARPCSGKHVKDGEPCECTGFEATNG